MCTQHGDAFNTPQCIDACMYVRCGTTMALVIGRHGAGYTGAVAQQCTRRLLVGHLQRTDDHRPATAYTGYGDGHTQERAKAASRSASGAAQRRERRGTHGCK